MSRLTEVLEQAGLSEDKIPDTEKSILESYRSKEETEKKAERIKELESEVADYREQVAKLSDTSELDSLRERVAKYEKADEERKAKAAEEEARAEFKKDFDKAVGDRRFVNERTEKSVFEDAYKAHVDDPDRKTSAIVKELVAADGTFANPQQEVGRMPVPDGGGSTSSEEADQRSFVASLFKQTRE